MRWPLTGSILLLPLLTASPLLAQTPEDRPRPPMELAPVPPSFVELVLQQILVERDLDAARKMLVDHLPKALNDHLNSEWTARVYVLLAAVASLGGDEVQARKLALRAVALNEAVSMEPQLGEVAQKVLQNARLEWRSRPATAVLEVSPLPIGLELWVDGGPLLLPAREPLRPGDHLIQVASRQGVVARAWVILKSGETLKEPPPLPEVRRTLETPPTLESVSMEEVTRLASEAAKAEADIQQVADALELEHSLARASRYTDRALCLAEVERQLGRLTEELSGFKLRLEQAMLRDRADEIRHLFEMIRLSRDEALKLQVEQEACLDQVQRGVDQELRVTQTPAQAKALPLLEAQPLEGLKTESRAHRAYELVAFRPPKPRFELSRGGASTPSKSNSPANPEQQPAPARAPGGEPEPATWQLRTDIWVEGAARQTWDASEAQTLAGMRVAPAVQLASPHLSFEALWSIGLFQLNRLEDYALSVEGGGLPHPGKQERSWQLGLDLGQQVAELPLLIPTNATTERAHEQLVWTRQGILTSSIETQQRVILLREHLEYAASDGDTTTEQPLVAGYDAVQQERFSLTAEAGLRWKLYPYSHLLAELGGELVGYPEEPIFGTQEGSILSALPSPMRFALVRGRAGVEGLLLPQLTIRLLPALTWFQGFDNLGQGLEGGSIWDGVGGAVSLTLGHQTQQLELQLERQLHTGYEVHRLLYQGVGLKGKLKPSPAWSISGEAQLGQEQGRWWGLSSSEADAYFKPGTYSQRVWQGRLEAQLQPFDELPLWLSLRYVGGSRGETVIQDENVGNRNFSAHTVHQLFLGGVARY
ncbi:MAG: hypothetical protein ACKO6N_15870 [Myxococcota bacterium]